MPRLASAFGGSRKEKGDTSIALAQERVQNLGLQLGLNRSWILHAHSHVYIPLLLEALTPGAMGAAMCRSRLEVGCVLAHVHARMGRVLGLSLIGSDRRSVWI